MKWGHYTCFFQECQECWCVFYTISLSAYPCPSVRSDILVNVVCLGPFLRNYTSLVSFVPLGIGVATSIAAGRLKILPSWRLTCTYTIFEFGHMTHINQWTFVFGWCWTMIQFKKAVKLACDLLDPSLNWCFMYLQIVYTFFKIFSFVILKQTIRSLRTSLVELLYPWWTCTDVLEDSNYMYAFYFDVYGILVLLLYKIIVHLKWK